MRAALGRPVEGDALDRHRPVDDRRHHRLALRQRHRLRQRKQRLRGQLLRRAGLERRRAGPQRPDCRFRFHRRRCGHRDKVLPLLARFAVDGHLGPLHVVTREQRLPQCPRAAADQGHRHVAPVLPAGVLEDRPALQQSIALAGDQPPARLPQGHLGEIAQPHRPRRGAGQPDLELALLRRAALGQPRQDLVHLPLQLGIREGQPVDGLEDHRADALRPGEAQPVACRPALAFDDFLARQRQDPAVQAGPAHDLDLRPAQAGEQARQVDQVALGEGHVAKQVAQGRRPLQAHRAHGTVAHPARSGS